MMAGPSVPAVQNSSNVQNQVDKKALLIIIVQVVSSSHTKPKVIMRNFPILPLSAMGGFIATASLASGITLGQIDDFQSGNTAGWAHGVSNPNAPRVIADDGPAGTGDFALTVSASGAGGAGSRLVMFNLDQWRGDYLAAGVTGIRFDTRHNDGPDLRLRIAFEGPGGRFALAEPIALGAASGWVTHQISLVENLFQHLGGGSGSWAATMGDVSATRLLSSASPSWLGDSVAASVSFDNIQAIPEPRMISLLAGLFVLGLLFRRRLAIDGNYR